MYDSSDCDWSDDKISDYWKKIEVELDKRLGFKKDGSTYKCPKNPIKKQKRSICPHKKIKDWTPEDTRRLYPGLTEEEAKKAWEMGW